jgi:cytochrome c
MLSTILKTLGMASIGLVTVAGAVFAAQAGGPAKGASDVQLAAHSGPDLAMPTMDPVRGKMLFASKGCVVCHSINGVGGTDAPNLDASTMTPRMNPFDFFAKMWRGAQPMIAMQNEELGQQIEFTGQDLADIVAFVHDEDVQKTFSEKDIPDSIKDLMEEDEEQEGGSETMGPGMQGDMGSSQGMGPGMMGGQHMR